MVSSKGEPTNPKLREQCKQEVLNMEKGGGKGAWSAWKAGELARLYESKGGEYKDRGDNKNKAQTGPPERKDGKDNTGVAGKKKDDKKDEKKDTTTKTSESKTGEKDKDKKSDSKSDSKKTGAKNESKSETKTGDKEKEKEKTNDKKKSSGTAKK